MGHVLPDHVELRLAGVDPLQDFPLPFVLQLEGGVPQLSDEELLKGDDVRETPQAGLVTEDAFEVADPCRSSMRRIIGVLTE